MKPDIFDTFADNLASFLTEEEAQKLLEFSYDICFFLEGLPEDTRVSMFGYKIPCVKESPFSLLDVMGRPLFQDTFPTYIKDFKSLIVIELDLNPQANFAHEMCHIFIIPKDRRIKQTPIQDGLPLSEKDLVFNLLGTACDCPKTPFFRNQPLFQKETT